MNKSEQPFISPEQILPEITFKVIILTFLLAIILAAANTFLALKIGILTSASIPAAMLSMGILHFFKRSNILENNLIQTGASAGEAIAGGVVYTVPALIIIRYWTHFDYLQTASITLIGGILGVLFSVPIRKILVHDKQLRFPEGRAIAEVLKTNENQTGGLKYLISGGTIGALIELAQAGFNIISSQIQIWYMRGNTLFGFGFGFSATLVGAGYLMGFSVGLSIMLGAIIGWIIGVPTISSFYHLDHSNLNQTVMYLWNSKIRYIGIGAMLTAGLWSFLCLYKPLWQNIKNSLRGIKKTQQIDSRLRTERDIPLIIICFALVGMSIWMLSFFSSSFNLATLNISHSLHIPFYLITLVYILVVGFIFSVICGYFSGMVGVTASPGSAIIIAGMLIAAIAIRALLTAHGQPTIAALKQGAAITIIIGAIITGAAAVTNDNIQDLKVGQLLGATPWKQQFMLLFGAVVSALVIPPIMEVLFNVYGIAGVFPHPGMDVSAQLPAPPAALMAAITQGVFRHNLPWDMFGLGIVTIIVCIILNQGLKRSGRSLSVLGLAIGMYLPLTTSTPLFVGSLIALLTKQHLQRRRHQLAKGEFETRQQRGILLACGLVAGAAVMNVIIAIPFAIAHNPDIMKIMPKQWLFFANDLGVLTLVVLSLWLYWSVCKRS